MPPIEQIISPHKTIISSTKVKLVRDATGGVQLTTENNEILENVFVKEYQRIEGSVTRLQLEVIFLTRHDKVKNW